MAQEHAPSLGLGDKFTISSLIHGFLVQFVITNLERVSKSDGVVASLFDKIQNSPVSEKHSRVFQEKFTVSLV